VTKENELAALLDAVFDSYPNRPDFAAVRELAYLSKNSSWLITELLKVLWLYSHDEAAFDEYIWRMVDSME
jgi:hypothetical protein